jgi:outer membrane protein
MNNDGCTLVKIIIFAKEKNNNKINRKMRKLAKLLFAVVLTMGVSFGVNAQSLKVGHVDSAAIMEILPERTQLEQELQAYAAELQSEIQAMYGEYQNKAQDYQANEATMSNLIRQSKQKEILDLETRIREFEASADMALQNKQMELINPLIEKVQNAVNAVGQEQGFTYILDKSVGAVVFIGDNAIDITADVKTKLGL